MAVRSSGAAVGFTIKSGWAAVVVLSGSSAEPVVASNTRIELSDPDEPDQRQPYHAGFGTARAADAMLARLLKGVKQYGRRSVDDALHIARSVGHEISLRRPRRRQHRRSGDDRERSHPHSRARGQVVSRGGRRSGGRERHRLHHLARTRSLRRCRERSRSIRGRYQKRSRRAEEDDERRLAQRAEGRGDGCLDSARCAAYAVSPPVSAGLGDLRFTSERLSRPPSSRWCAETTLHHFAIVTYLVDPESLRRHLHPRFEPDLLEHGPNAGKAAVSAVTFLDRDFRFSGLPWVRASFGQTNYRAYVRDRDTGEHVVWFFGTCVDSMTVAIPRYAWKLPWHRALFTFDCDYDEQAKCYGRSMCARHRAGRPRPSLSKTPAARRGSSTDSTISNAVSCSSPIRCAAISIGVTGARQLRHLARSVAAHCRSRDERSL